MKSSGKQPFIIVLLILFLSMKKTGKKKSEVEKDENYWRVVGGL